MRAQCEKCQAPLPQDRPSSAATSALSVPRAPRPWVSAVPTARVSCSNGRGALRNESRVRSRIGSCAQGLSLSGADLEGTAQTLFRLWRDEGWGPWLEPEAIPEPQQARGQALLARFEELTQRHGRGDSV